MGSIRVLKGTTTPIDISRFVIDMDDIPITTRNRDYTLVAEGINITISSDISDETAPSGTFSITSGPLGSTSTIQILHDDAYLYTGNIESIEQNYGKNTFTITLVHPFQRLKEYYNYANDMDAYYDNFKETYTIYDHTNPAVTVYTAELLSIHQLLAAHFLRIGLTYDSSSCLVFPEYRRTNGGLEWSEPSFVFRDMLYAINQTYAGTNGAYGSVDAIRNRLTCWDNLSFYASIFRMNFRFSKYNEVYAFRNQLAKEVIQDKYDLVTEIPYANLIEYSSQNIPKYFPSPNAVSFEYQLGGTASYSDPFAYQWIYNDPYVNETHTNTNITTDGKYDDFRQSAFLNNVVFPLFVNIGAGNTVADNAYYWWAGGGSTSVRNDANETLIRDNNVTQEENFVVNGFNLSTSSVKPVESVYLIPDNYELSGSELVKIQQFTITLSAD